MVGGTVALVQEIKIGPGSRLARDASGHPLVQTETVRIADLWDGYEAGKTRAQIDATIALTDPAAWWECAHHRTGRLLADGRDIAVRQQRPHLGYRNLGRRPWDTVSQFVRKGD